MSDENEFLIRKLRELALVIKEGANQLRGDFQMAQTIAARLYLKHSNRSMTLSTTDFDEVVDVLKMKQEV
ncbi:MAG: hypothetical protein GPJ54_10890 [Candidatus Heimdallarchaeota archaeon]|nr:hypothetical protein [Candidatus Heimdallarchaeota archaeon]